MNEYVKRIDDNVLISDYKDGEILQHTDVNAMIDILKQGINANYEDIQKVTNGELTVGEASKLSGASLVKSTDGVLDDSDTSIPSSNVVKKAIQEATPVKGEDYFTDEDVAQIVSASVEAVVSDVNQRVEQNYIEKTEEFDTHVEDKKIEIDIHTVSKKRELDEQISTEINNLEQYVSEFIEDNKDSLRGPQGPQGPEGPQGPQGEAADLTNYYTKTEIDNKNYITSIPSEYVTETELNNKGYLTSVPSQYVTETELNNKGYLTEEDIGDIDVDLTDYYTKEEIDNKYYQTEEGVEELIGYALKRRMGVLAGGIESPCYFYDNFYADPLKNLKVGAYYVIDSFILGFEAPNTSSVPNDTMLFGKNSIVYIDIFKRQSTYYYLITNTTGLAYNITIEDGTITEVIKIEPATKDYVDNLFNSIINGDEVSY